jgi:hypothetical protein
MNKVATELLMNEVKVGKKIEKPRKTGNDVLLIVIKVK